MQLQVNRSKLVNALSTVSTVIDSKTPHVVLQNVLIETTEQNTLKLTGYDTENAITIECETISIETPGKALVPAKQLLSILKSYPSDIVNIHVNQNTMSLKGGESKCKIIGVDVDQYPKIPSEENISLHPIDGPSIARIIKNTAFSASQDDSRFPLNGICLETPTPGIISACATDGHRLALMITNSGNQDFLLKQSIIVKTKCLSVVRETLDTTTSNSFIGISDNLSYMLVKNGSTTIMIRLVDGTFPDYKEIIPNDKDILNHLIMNRQQLINELNLMKALADGDKTIGTKFSCDGKSNNLCIALDSSGTEGMALIPFESEKPCSEFMIGFNTLYLLEALQVITGEKAMLSLSDEQSPGVLSGCEHSDFSSVIMPMRV